MPYYQRNGRALFYAIEGSGKPMVLIHGYLGDSETHWGEQLRDPNLQSKFQIIAPDLRGFGKSALGEKGETNLVSDILDDLRDLITNHLHLNHGKFPILVGYSVGAAIVLDYATMYPNEVSGICLLSPRPFTRKTASSHPFLSKKNRNKSKLSAFLWNILKRVQKEVSRRSIVKTAKNDPARLDRLSAIKHIPTLLVYALKDTVTPQIAFSLLKENLPTAIIKVFPGDHGINHEDAEVFNLELFQFFNRK